MVPQAERVLLLDNIVLLLIGTKDNLSMSGQFVVSLLQTFWRQQWVKCQGLPVALIFGFVRFGYNNWQKRQCNHTLFCPDLPLIDFELRS